VGTFPGARGVASNNFDPIFSIQIAATVIRWNTCNSISSIAFRTINAVDIETTAEWMFLTRQCGGRKINLRAKVSGFDRTSKYWRFSYPTMPPFMAFAIDADKDCYYHLFPEYRCYDIHDALGTPFGLGRKSRQVQAREWICRRGSRFISRGNCGLRLFGHVRSSVNIIGRS
jgi:hypothetical protein